MMKTRRMMLRCSALLALSGVLAACTGATPAGEAPPAASPTASGKERADALPASPANQARLLVLHTNDVMGYVDPCG